MCNDKESTERKVQPPLLSRRSALSLLGVVSVAAGAVAAPEAAAQETTSVLEKVRQSGVLRASAIPGELPSSDKNPTSGEWYGFAPAMVRDLGTVLDVDVEFFETTFGGAILALQSGQINIAISLSATPQRALAIDFTTPMYDHGFGVLAGQSLDPKVWADVNKPEITVGVTIGSNEESVARRFVPQAEIRGHTGRDDVILALSAGQIDCAVFAMAPGLTAVKRNPSMGRFVLLDGPTVYAPSSIGVRHEVDKSWRDFINIWLNFNRGNGQLREWIQEGFAANGILPEDLPTTFKI